MDLQRILLLLGFAASGLLSLQAQEYDPYGGYTGVSQQATGYFSLGESNGRHCFFSPVGNAFLSIGLNHWHTTGRTDYDNMIAELKTLGFNSGDYQGPRWQWDRIPYTKGINLTETRTYSPEQTFGFRDVFDPVYLAELDGRIKSIVEPQAEKKMLIGYFLTDMPLWAKSKYGTSWLHFFRNLPADSPGGLVWAAWKTENPSFDEELFLGVIAQQLYSEATRMIRTYDPNHLVFSERFNERDLPEAVLRAAMEHVDVIATQPVSQYNAAYFDWLYQVSRMPVFIADHVSSFRTDEFPVTMGQVAQNEDDYIVFLENYVETVWSLPWIIGYNKCQYRDEDQGSLLKQGLYRINGQPYDYVQQLPELFGSTLEKAYRNQLSAGIPPAPGDWELSFEDEFDLEHVDPDKWRQGPNVSHFNGIAANDGDQVRVSGGALELEAEKRDAIFSGKSYAYASGEMTTFRKFRQLYGYFEARIKYEPRQGSWPAFWLMPDDGNRGPEDALREIYMRFDLQGITEPVSSAQLQFHIASMSNQDCGLTVHRLLAENWDENSLTWNNRPRADPVWLAELTSTTDPAKTDQFDEGDLISIDVTAELNAALAAGTGLGFTIRDQFKRSVYINIPGRESSLAADRPRLLIDGESHEASDDAFVRGGQYAGDNYGSEATLTLYDPWFKSQGTDKGGMEMDIMETLGIWGQDHNSNALHWDNYGEDHKSTGSGKYSVPPTTDGFHTYGMLWKPGKIEFYVDGTQKWEWENERVGSVAGYIHLSHQMGGWDGNDEVIDEDLPATVSVDYVRVYRNRTGASVSITEPEDKSQHSVGQNVVVKATVEQWGAMVSHLELYLDDSFIASDAEAPYEFIMPGQERGLYQVLVKAITSSGETAGTDSITLSFSIPPQISITSPEDSTAFTAPGDPLIRAEVSPSEADARVTFYLNGEILQTLADRPFELALAELVPGRYSIEAEVEDELGLTASANPVFFSVQGGPIPEPWIMTDIGVPVLAGSGSYYQESFYLEGAGKGLASDGDEFNFVHQQLGDSSEIRARLLGIDDRAGDAVYGLMMRESLEPDAPMIGLVADASGVIRLLFRQTPGGTASSMPFYPPVPFPVWLRIERQGGNFACYSSPDSVSWSKVLNKDFPFEMEPFILGGMAISSPAEDAHAIGILDQARVLGTGSPVGISGSDQPQILLYPNPSDGRLRIELAGQIPAASAMRTTVGQVDVLDMDGRLLHSRPMTGSRMDLDLGQLPAGIYQLRYSNEELKLITRVLIRD